jgi:hypothetical protein
MRATLMADEGQRAVRGQNSAPPTGNWEVSHPTGMIEFLNMQQRPAVPGGTVFAHRVTM